MTVAICFLTPEGVVLGADSTASFMMPDGGLHYLNFNQKVFQVGETGTLGIVTWGLASLGVLSHRTQIAQLVDDLELSPPANVAEVASRWIAQFWPKYSAIAATEISQCRQLHAKKEHDKSISPTSGMRTEQEEILYKQLRIGLVAGFCIGGYHKADRTPQAFEIIFDPLKDAPTPVLIPVGSTRCWGAPKIFLRLIHGIDQELKEAILNSGKWNGTEADLSNLVASHHLHYPMLPIRDAIDFVHSCILSTIKALKFSLLSQVCGGPIELAVITTDRPFRWVRHKEWDAAIMEGNPQ